VAARSKLTEYGKVIEKQRLPPPITNYFSKKRKAEDEGDRG